MRRLETYSHNIQKGNIMNPFELRFSIFNSAKDLLIKQHEANMMVWNALDEASKKAQDLAPKYPTIEEIVDKAIEINKFISESGVNEISKLGKRLTSTAVIW